MRGLLGISLLALALPVRALAGIDTAEAAGQATAGVSSSSVPDAPTPQNQSSDELTLKQAPRRVLHDQAQIWTSPGRTEKRDLLWIAPLLAATGVGIATDHSVMADQVTRDSSINNAGTNASNGLVYGLVAVPVTLFGVGELKHSPHAAESGYLTGEALVGSLIVQEGLKLVSRRERPKYDNAHGLFFNHNAANFNSSFPSAHATVAWTIAGALAEEYPSHWAQIGLYSAAGATSVSRVIGRDHFPTDVLVGSSVGWLIGHYVVHEYKRHHPMPGATAVSGAGQCATRHFWCEAAF